MAEKKPVITTDRAFGLSVAAGAFGLSRISSRKGSARLRTAQKIARRKEFFGLEPSDPRFRTAFKLAEKRAFSKAFKKDAIPSKTVTEAIGKARTSKAAVQEFPKKFLIKPRKGALAKPGDFLTDLNVKQRPGQLKKILAKPEKFIVQPRINIKKEFRATVSQGKVTSVTKRRTFKRTQIGSVIPVFGKERRAIKTFVEASIKRSTVNAASTGIVGFDVAKTSRGFKLVEANIGPGDLLNPIKRLKAKTRLLGRLPRRTAIVASLAAGALASLVIRRTRKRPKKAKEKRKGKVIFRRIRGRIVPIRIKDGA